MVRSVIDGFGFTGFSIVIFTSYNGINDSTAMNCGGKGNI